MHQCNIQYNCCMNISIRKLWVTDVDTGNDTRLNFVNCYVCRVHAGAINSMLILFCSLLGVMSCMVMRSVRITDFPCSLIHNATLDSVLAGVFFAVRAPGIVGPYFVLISEIYTEMQHILMPILNICPIMTEHGPRTPPPQIKTQQRLTLKTVLCFVQSV